MTKARWRYDFAGFSTRVGHHNIVQANTAVVYTALSWLPLVPHAAEPVSNFVARTYEAPEVDERRRHHLSE